MYNMMMMIMIDDKYGSGSGGGLGGGVGGGGSGG